jgi:hypothetical protein
MLTLRCQIGRVIFLALCVLWMLNNGGFILRLAGLCGVGSSFLCVLLHCFFFSAVYPDITCGNALFLCSLVVLF